MFLIFNRELELFCWLNWGNKIMENEFIKILYDHWLIIFGIIATLGLSAVAKKFRKSGQIKEPKGNLKENFGCEKKLDQEVWDILQKIKTNMFHTKKDELLVKYKKTFTKFTEEYEREETILEKIEDMGAIKIIKAEDAPGYLHKYIMNNPTTTLTVKNLDMSRYITDSIFLHIFSKFDEVYKKYESKFIKNEDNQNKN
jgi:hypothetical protein